jgi:hypothetical protein
MLQPCYGFEKIRINRDSAAGALHVSAYFGDNSRYVFPPIKPSALMFQQSKWNVAIDHLALLLPIFLFDVFY